MLMINLSWRPTYILMDIQHLISSFLKSFSHIFLSSDLYQVTGNFYRNGSKYINWINNKTGSVCLSKGDKFTLHPLPVSEEIM